jgi:hypothetical protein
MAQIDSLKMNNLSNRWVCLRLELAVAHPLTHAIGIKRNRTFSSVIDVSSMMYEGIHMDEYDSLDDRRTLFKLVPHGTHPSGPCIGLRVLRALDGKRLAEEVDAEVGGYAYVRC